MHKFVYKFIFASKFCMRNFVSNSKNVVLSHVDRSRNLVYGGDLSVPTARQSIGSVLFERLTKKERENDILQVCTLTNYGMTTKKYVENAVGVAERLKTEGIKKGDIIVLVGNNSLNMNAALAGIFFLGAVPFPITHKTTKDEFKMLLKFIKPKYCACDRANLFSFQNVLKEVGDIDPTKIFLLNQTKDSEEELECFVDFIQGRGQNIETFKPADVDDPENQLALVMKGARNDTYGKAIGITHHNINSIIARYESGGLDFEALRVILMVQKVMWMSGIYSLFLACCFGSKLIVMSEFDENRFVEAIEDYRVTSSFVYSSSLWLLYKHQFDRDYDLSSCKYVEAFDGALSPILISGLKEKLGLNVRQCYSVSELTGIALQPTEPGRQGPLGKLVPQLYGKVISDKSFQKLGPYEKGEICFKGPIITKGYLNDPVSTRRLFDKNGFLLSGLYGYYDDEGNFFVIDKIHYVIKYKDYEVSPRELEGIIKSLDEVRDAIVSGIQHPTDGYYPMAFVSLQKEKDMTAEQIINYVNGKVEDHKKLRGGVIFIPKIPRSRDNGALKRNLFRKVLSKYRLMSEVSSTAVKQKMDDNAPRI